MSLLSHNIKINTLFLYLTAPSPLLGAKNMVYLSALSLLRALNDLNAEPNLVLSHRPNRSAVFILNSVSDRAGARLITQRGHTDLSSAGAGGGVIQKSMHATGLAMLHWQDDGRLLLSGRWRCYLWSSVSVVIGEVTVLSFSFRGSRVES